MELVFVGAAQWHVRLHKGKQMFEMFAKVLSWDKTGHLGLTLLRLLVLGYTRACSVSAITLPWEVSITSLSSLPSCSAGLQGCALRGDDGKAHPHLGKRLNNLWHLAKSTSSAQFCHTGDTAQSTQAVHSHSRAALPTSGKWFTQTPQVKTSETLCWLQVITLFPTLCKWGVKYPRYSVLCEL